MNLSSKCASAFQGLDFQMSQRYEIKVRSGFNFGVPIPRSFGSYDLASEWVGNQAPGVQMYLSIVPCR
tara:strand:- start:19025 stop:19228 length:204 start_codon:yes stop_codon:yes gene_type:complete